MTYALLLSIALSGGQHFAPVKYFENQESCKAEVARVATSFARTAHDEGTNWAWQCATTAKSMDPSPELDAC